MPITKSAKKALRTSLEKKDVNDRVKKNLKEKIKIVEKAVREKKKNVAELMNDAYSAIDKAAKNGTIKKNTASRRKSKVSRIAKAK